MKHGKWNMGIIGVSVMAALLFSACQESGKPGAPTPVAEQAITFGLAAGSLEDYMGEIRNNNDALVNLLQMKKDTGEKLNPEDWDKWMGKTYLNRPRLIENGNPIEDMKQIIPALNAIIAKSRSFRWTKARLDFEFIPYDETPGSRWMSLNDGRPPERQINFIGHVEVTIKYNGDFTMTGALPHRHNCEPEL